MLILYVFVQANANLLLGFPTMCNQSSVRRVRMYVPELRIDDIIDAMDGLGGGGSHFCSEGSGKR
jgi:hypothetical protein